MHADNLKAAIMNVGEYRAILAALKASQPTKAELAAIVEELTGIKAASSATVRDLFRSLELYGQSERRREARAKHRAGLIGGPRHEKAKDLDL